MKEKNPFAALKYIEFRYFLSMRFFLTLAFQIQTVVLGWFIYSITKDALSLGLIGLAEAIPAIGIALYGGYIADKYDRVLLLRIALIMMLISSVCIQIIVNPAVSSNLPITTLIWSLYGLIFVIGLARGFYAPAAFSLMSMIIPREYYANSSTWNSSLWQTASIAGPAVGGLLYSFIGITYTLLIVVCFILLAIFSLIFIKRKPPQFVQKDNILESLKEGLKFVFNNKVIVGALSLDLFSVFFGGAVALIPIVASDILHVGAKEFGFMRAAPAVGAVITMLIMTRFSPMNKPWRNLLIAITGFGFSIICFGLSKNYYWSLVFLFLEGSFDSISVVIRSTLLQLLTPDEMRGRVSAVNSMFIGSSNEIGQFESGLTAKLMKTVPAIIFGGGMTLIVVAATWFKTKKLVHLSLDELSNNKI